MLNKNLAKNLSVITYFNMNYKTLTILFLAFIFDDQINGQINQCSYYVNYESNGVLLPNPSIVSTQNECCLLCQLNSQCQSWTWANPRYCYLRSNVGQGFYSLGSINTIN